MTAAPFPKDRRFASRVRALGILFMLANIAAVFIVAGDAPMRPIGGAVLAAVGFWLVVTVFPAVVNRELLLSPGNWFLFLFFVSMAVGPSIMLNQELLPRLWILTAASWDTSRIDDYLVPASVLWSLAFLAYAVGRSMRQRPSVERDRMDGGEPPQPWMLLTGVALVAVGLIGLVLATGSVSAVLALRGRHSASVAAFVSGTYRYTVWMEAVPVAAALAWYYLVRSRRIGPRGALFLAVVLYLPLFPFYLYSSGRGRTLLPFILLLALYSRFVRRVRFWWILVGMLVLLPLLASWSLYRRGTADFNLAEGSVAEVVAADFSRYDVGVVALAGFREGRLPYYLGSTFEPAVTSWLPGYLGRGGTEGTGAMAQAMAGSTAYDIPSSYATSIVTESYLNFGLVGVTVLPFLLGLAATALDRLAASRSILTTLFGMALALKIPFGSSFVIASSQVVWAVGLPFATLYLARIVLRERERQLPPPVVVPTA